MLEGRCHDLRSRLAYQPRASEGRLGKGIALNEKEKGIPRLRKENLTTRQELRKLSSPMKGVSEASWDKLMASNVGKQKFNEVVKTIGL